MFERHQFAQDLASGLWTMLNCAPATGSVAIRGTSGASASWRLALGGHLKSGAVSIGHRNGLCQGLCWGSPSEHPTWATVELKFDAGHVALGEAREIRSFGKVLPKEAVGVLVRGALPRAARITEVHRDVRRSGESAVGPHLSALIPRQRMPKRHGQGTERVHERLHHSSSDAPDRQQHQATISRPPFDQGPNSRASELAQQKIAFPMSGLKALKYRQWALVNGDHLLQPPIV